MVKKLVDSMILMVYYVKGSGSSGNKTAGFSNGGRTDMAKINLIRIRYWEREDTQKRQQTCLINPFDPGGEYTFCGERWTGGEVIDFHVESLGNPFAGTYKKITCRRCKAMLQYAKEVIESGEPKQGTGRTIENERKRG
jgi:hypothetical protein